MSERFFSAPTAAIAAFATSQSSSSTSARSSRSKASGRIDSSRAASRRARRPASPFSSTIFDSSSFAASMFCARPGPRQERDDRGLDREVLEVTERLDPLERVHRIEFGEVQQRLGSDAKIRILHQCLDLILDRRIAGARQQPHRLLADRGILVTQEAADGRMHLAIVRQLEQAERVGDLLRRALQPRAR